MPNATATLPSLPNLAACQPYQPTGPTYNVEGMIRPGVWFALVQGGNVSAEIMATCCGTSPVQLYAQKCELFCEVPQNKYANISNSNEFSRCLGDNGARSVLVYGQGRACEGKSSALARAGVPGVLGLMCLGLFAAQAFMV